MLVMQKWNADEVAVVAGQRSREMGEIKKRRERRGKRWRRNRELGRREAGKKWNESRRCIFERKRGAGRECGRGECIAAGGLQSPFGPAAIDGHR